MSTVSLIQHPACLVPGVEVRIRNLGIQHIVFYFFNQQGILGMVGNFCKTVV